MKLLYVFKERAFVIAICNSLVLRDDLFDGKFRTRMYRAGPEH
jgi:hypothetical protein